jgi:hypothetical protein
VEKAGREIKLQFLEEIQDLIMPHYAKKWRKKCKFMVKLNDYWTNLYKS